ncbi:hypothetical protein, partial [Streptomyces sp. NPDC017991]|uniref:hypothetical protein n=1 Tax=Streptomyces sp. NPDC017991 TaxID=3365026 RepID=UPI00379287D7
MVPAFVGVVHGRFDGCEVDVRRDAGSVADLDEGVAEAGRGAVPAAGTVPGGRGGSVDQQSPLGFGGFDDLTELGYLGGRQSR